MASFSYTNGTKATTGQTLIEGDTGATPPDDTGNIDSSSSLIVASGPAVTLNIAAAPAGAGLVLTNAGTLTSSNGRTIDSGSNAAYTPTGSNPGAKITINNTATFNANGVVTSFGTITNSGGASGNDDVIRIGQDIPNGTFLLYNNGAIVSQGNVNDSVGVRLGKIYTAATITIDNGIDSNGNINTKASITTLDADAIRPGGVNTSGTATGFGSSTVLNYGMISAADQNVATTATTPLSKDNAIDIGAGQASTVINFGTIVGDESGLGADNTAGTLLFAPTYYVTNNLGATITGNNGPGIAIGNNTSTTAPSTTSTITNYGTITGQATGVGRTPTSGKAPTVSAADGTGIYSAYVVTIVNGSATNTGAIIQGEGLIGTPAAAQVGTTTTYVYNAVKAASGTITNYGTIQETTATSAGAAVYFTGTANSTVSNYGSIVGANGLAIQFGNATNTLNLYTGSSETGAIVGGTGTDTLNLNLGASTTTGTLSGVSAFEVLRVVGGVWTLADSESYSGGIAIGASGVLNLAQSAALTGAVTDNGALTFADTGTFTFANTTGGTGSVSQNGNGTLVLSGSDSYNGGTNLNAGTLDVASSAGTGAITFGAGTATLQIEQTALTANQPGGGYGLTNNNTIASVGTGSLIDLRNTGTETSESFNTSANQLTLSGAQSITLNMSAAAPSGYAYGFTSDGAGGTKVVLDQVATVTHLSTSQPSGFVTAGQTFTIYVALSKAVTVSGSGPTLTLSDGGTASYNSSESNGTTLAFDTTVAPGQNAAGVQITSIANAGTAQDSNNVAVNFANAINQQPIAPTIDASTPIVTISNAGGLTNQPTQTISGTVNTSADPETTGSTVSVLDGNTVIGMAPVSSGGAWSISVTLSGNGPHNLTASDTDAAGNIGTSNTVTYNLDTSTPTVSISNAGGLTNQASQTISGTVDTTADPQTAGTTVTVYDNSTFLGTAMVSSGGSWSLGSAITLVNGQNVLSASDTDHAGNTGTSRPVTYTLSTATPSVTISNAGGLTNQASQTISGTVNTSADSYAAGTTVTIYDNGTAVGTATVGSGGSWTAMNSFTLSSGQNTITASDTDQAGNTGTSQSVTYTLSTTTPSVAISNAGGLTNQASQTISGTVNTSADSYAAGTAVTIYDNGTAVASATVGSGGSWTAASAITLSSGQNTITASDTDQAGNTGSSSAVTYTLDTATPSVTISSQGGLTNQASQTISGTVNTSADPYAAGSSVTIYDNGTAVGTATVGTNGSWTSSSPITLSNGQNTVTASDTDRGGNTGTSGPVTYTLDTTPPSVAIVSPGGTVAQAEQTISGTVDTADAGTTVTVYEGSTALGTALVGANGGWETSVVLQNQGQNTITAQDTDAAGNVGASNSVAFDVEPTTTAFTKGNLVVSLSGDTDGTGTYTDNQATPAELEQITTSGAVVSSLILPQSTVTINGVTEYAFSSEYGSSSEGSVQLSADGKSLVIAGYGVNAQTYNTGGAAVYGNAALAQSTSLTNQTAYTPVGRVIADISSTGAVDTSTELYNVFNTNNPRSVATINGSSFYISGQGVKGDKTQGLYLTQDGSSTVTPIYQGTDTRTATIYNGVLYVSTDSKQPSGTGTSNIASYGGLPTSATAPMVLQGINHSIVLTSAEANTINASAVGTSVNLDPENFFFANANTLYVADGGVPKEGGVGDGGLQKWTYNGSSWTLDYTLSQGLNIVPEGSDEGTTGLIGLTGKVVGNTVELYATNETAGDLDQKYVFSISDQLNATSAAPSGESFTTIYTAPDDTNVRGIAFAPSTQAPTVAITSTAGLTNQPTQTITGTVDVADAGTTVNLIRSGATIGSAVVGLDGTWSANVTLTSGTNTIVASDTDAYGNTGSSSPVTYTLDTATPTVTIANAGGPTSQTSQTISGTVDTSADPYTAGSTVTVSDNGTVVETTTVNSGGSWALGTPITLVNGQNVITASDTDQAGNTGTSSPVTYTLDTATPNVTIANSGGPTNQTSQTISGTVDISADPEAANTIVTVYDNGNKAGTATVGPNGAWTSTTITLTEGQNSITASDTNPAGTTGTSSAVDYTLQTADPTVTISNAGGPTNVASQTISGTVDTSADPEVAGTKVTVYDNNVSVGTATVASDGSWNSTIQLSSGQNTVTASDTDLAGNTGTSSPVSYTLVTTDPTVTISNAGGPTNVASQTISGTVDTSADPTAPNTVVTVFDNGANVGTATVSSSGTWALSTPVTLSTGQNSFTASDTDEAGNTGTSNAVIYTYSTTTPTVTISNAGGPTNQASQTISGTVNTTTDPEAVGSTVTVTDNSTNVGSATVGQDGSWSLSKPITLTSGQNTIVASDTDEAGNTGTSGSVAYTYSTTPPTVTISNAGGPTNQASQTISGTVDVSADPEAPGSTVTVTDNNTVVGSATVASGGSWALSNPITLSSGQNTIVASDTDEAGNTGTSGSVVYTYSTTTPTVTISNAGGPTNQANQTISGTVDVSADPEAVGSAVTVTDNGTNVGSATVNSDGSWALSTPITLTGGQNTIVASDTDEAGNTGTSGSVAYTYSTTTPTVTISNAGGPTNQASQTISGTVNTTADPEAVGSTVTVTDNNTVVGSATVASGGSWALSTPITLTGGQNTIVASDTDEAGNTGTSGSVVYTYSTTTPTVTISNAGGPTNQASQTISGTVDVSADPEAVGSTVTVTDNNTVVGSATVASGGSWALSTPITLSSGQNTIVASDTDEAGNTGTSGSVVFTYSTTTPTVTISNVGGPTNQASQTISGTVDTTADPEAPGSTVTVTDNNTVVGSATVASGGSWALSTPISLSSGQNTIVASDTDEAGNTGTSGSVVYTYSTTTPTVTISNAGGPTNQTSQTISGTVDVSADPEAVGSTVTVYDNNKAIGSATVSSSGGWTSGAITLVNGQNVITAKDTDQAGNTGSSGSVTYTLDTATPNVAITSAGGKTNQASQTISGTVNTTADPETIGTQVTVFDNGTSVGTATVGSGGGWTSSAITLTKGQNVITASDTDTAGNTGTSGSVTYTLDQSPTVVAETASVLAGGTVTATASNGALAGDTASSGGTLSVTSVSYGNTTDQVPAGGTATIAGKYGTLQIGSDGSYNYTAGNGLAIVTAPDGSTLTDTFGDVVSDGQGNTSSSSLAITTSLSGGSETVTNASGSATFTIGATTLNINEQASSTYSGKIQDGSSYSGGVVTVSGPGTLTLTGANTYTGITTVTGTLDLTGSGSIAGSRKLQLTASGAVFDVSGATAPVSINKLVGVAGTTIDLGATSLSVNQIAGTGARATGVFAGTIQNGPNGSGGVFTVGGPGPLILTGVNTYTGVTTVTGTLDLTGSGSIASSRKLQLTAAGAVFDVSGATAPVSIDKLVGVAGTTIDVGATSLSINQIAGTGLRATGVFAGTIQDGTNGSGGAVTIGGPGPLILTGVNTYTGVTSVTGALDLTGSGSITGSRKLQLTAAGATFDISGASGPVSINKLVGVAGTTINLGANSLSINQVAGTGLRATGVFAGTIQNGPNGTGGQLAVNGTGPLILTGTNTYSGGTTLNGGTLDLDASGAAGTGTITFAAAATLQIDAPALTSKGIGQYDFANVLAGFNASNRVIDLTSLAYKSSTTATASGTTLSVNNGSSDVTLHLASAQPSSTWHTASDGHGGTLVYDPPAAAQASGSAAGAKVDSSWVEMAMADWGGVTGDMNAHAQTYDPHSSTTLGLSSDQAHAAAVFGHGASRMA